MLSFRFFYAAAALLCVVSASPVPEQTPAPVLSERAPSPWRHPGLLNSQPQLDFIKGRVAANAQPWAGAFSSMLNDKIATSTRTPHATWTTVECGPTSTPNFGCTDEREDALAAYANALAWAITSDTKYAQKSISYMNAWAGTLQRHANSNSKLQEGWSAASWSRAAEIIAHTTPAGTWSTTDIATFKTFLRNVYLNNIIDGSDMNGNWELVMMEAAVGISVFLEDAASYDKAMGIFLARVPEYVYLLSDGSSPVLPPGKTVANFWNGMKSGNFKANGICQETCRDLTHTGYGLASIGHVAEMARNQGNDLYQTDVGTRLRYGLGFHAQFLDSVNPVPVPSYLCDGSGKLNEDLGPTTEVGLNALHFRLLNDMPHTLQYTLDHRPAGTNKLFLGWETLTHASQPN